MPPHVLIFVLSFHESICNYMQSNRKTVQTTQLYYVDIQHSLKDLS